MTGADFVRAARKSVRGAIASFLCAGVLSLPVEAQQGGIKAERPSGFIFIRPYKEAIIPPVKLTNSMRLQSLMQGGKLYLTAQDAIALALENNIDLQLDRYGPLTQLWNLERAQAGGALPGLPTFTTQSAQVASGQGAAGSQNAAGVSTNGRNTSGGNNTVGGIIQQIGSIAPSLDPVFQDTQSYSHTSTPQSNLQQTDTTNWIQSKHNYTESISQGLETGGQLTLTYNDSYLHENVPSDVLNPSNGTVLELTLRQNLLQGFGRVLNTRAITVANNTIRQDDLTFKTQVIQTVSTVLDNYYSLVADDEDVKAKRSAYELAQRFYEDNKKQVQIGTMAPLDVTTAESQVASTQRDLLVSQTNLAKQENSLKDLLSRTGLADPLLREADLVPLDHIIIPETDTTPPMKELLAMAMKNRADLKNADLNVENLRVNALNTQNAVLPSLGGQVSTIQQGLSGTVQPYDVDFVRNPTSSTSNPVNPQPQETIPGVRPCPAGIGRPGDRCEFPDPYFVGGIGTALGQMLRRNFPTNTAATQLNLTLRNRAAIADDNIDQLTIRQVQLQVKKTVNQVAVDVSNQLIALQQARVRYQAAVHNRILQQQLLEAEQKKFRLGASTSYLVVQQQQLLDAAQSTEIGSLVTYSTAKVALDQTLGITLQANNVSIQEATNGQVARASTLPAKLPSQP